ncbi:integral membrane [Fusarium albosuccineum]|uniref:Integral membrane n=1 Tax=Fusarium albosuccineum TaxID=1237068 RepID=A0A8H4KR92_9HYPO|nr:integral membrane [Fusarium albosuccineum]
MSQLHQTHINHYLRIALATQVLYAACLGFIKLSIVIMIQRIFRTAGKWFRLATWMAASICVCWMLYTMLIGFLICLPVQSAWGAAVPERCGNHITAYAAVAIIDIVSEVIIVLLPMKLVYDLQMNKAHKIGLVSVLGAGIVTITFSCVRLYYVYNIDFDNITRSYAEASISSILQSGIAVMIASSPLLRPVFDRTAKLFGLSLSSSRKTTTGNMNSSRSRTHGGGTSHISGSHSRAAGFKQMSESEEHLAWELQAMDKKPSYRQRTTVQATRLSDDSDEVQNGRTITIKTSIKRRA